MEWLGILLLYLISVYMKKRHKDAKQREIESDPDWDVPQEAPVESPQPNLDQMLSDLFGQTLKVEPEVPPVQEYEEEIVEPEPYHAPVHTEEHSSHIEKRADAFDKKIYRSKLGNRKEMRLGKKWRKKNKLRSELFQSRQSLKKAIILKEVLDIPLALR
ncbi:MAG TPA: hypothetical protein EYM60_01845 [Candidatus Marinimicrobia bacterium]|nr:hypothetical protein [Candidatus Neomarinimicrobiota bacterium]